MGEHLREILGMAVLSIVNSIGEGMDYMDMRCEPV